MSSIASLSSAPSALSSLTAHTHGHKKSSTVESSTSDSDGDAMTPVTPSTQQNLFALMLQTLEQTIGVQAATPAAASAPAATPAGSTAAGSSTASTTAAGSTSASSAAAGSASTAAPSTPASAAATASSSAALQKYHHNGSAQSNDLRFPTGATSAVRASA